MPPELLVSSAIAAMLLLALLARRRAAGRLAAADESAPGKRYIEAEIAAHIGALAGRYAEITAAAGHDDPERFRLEVESFIAEVLERDLDVPEAAELRDSVREVLVLEREYVYERVFAGIRAHQAHG